MRSVPKILDYKTPDDIFINIKNDDGEINAHQKYLKYRLRKKAM